MKLDHAILVALTLGLAGTAPAQYQPFAQDSAGGIVNCSSLPTERSRRPFPPQHIKIGKVIYTVELVKEVPAAAEFASFSGKTCDQRAHRLGVCDAKDRIYVEAEQTLEEEQTTLLHELQHAILGTEKSNQKITYHQFIHQLSPRLLEVLKENPELFLYLTASESK